MLDTQTIHVLALLLSTAIESRPLASPAEWADEETPDFVLGSHNDWLLRMDEETEQLYIQSRHGLGLVVITAQKLSDLCYHIRGNTGIQINMPWTNKEIRDEMNKTNA